MLLLLLRFVVRLVTDYLMSPANAVSAAAAAAPGDGPKSHSSPPKNSVAKDKRMRALVAQQRHAAHAVEHAAGGLVAAGIPAATHPQQHVNLNRRQIGANWQQLGIATMRPNPKEPTPPKRWPVNRFGVPITKYIAMDCEMVGVGYQGKTNMVARVSVVNQLGDVLMDCYVKPREPVVDYRTAVSGIRPHDIANGAEFRVVQAEVHALLFSRVLVGHAVYNDLRVLALQHPTRDVRDTSSYRPLANKVTGGATPSLKMLALFVLNEDIQSGEHSSVEDARAAMRIFNRYQAEWERSLTRRRNR